jgi:hypothetical protein
MNDTPKPIARSDTPPSGGAHRADRGANSPRVGWAEPAAAASLPRGRTRIGLRRIFGCVKALPR